jgi:3-dehydroquinate dehydratase-2
MSGSEEKPKILILHGPNLNMLGQREANWYGSATLAEIDTEVQRTAQDCGMVAETFQSNYEGALVEKIHEAIEAYDAIVINPAAYTHTSVAIRDALLMLDVPIIEVHLSNIYRREPFRHKSLIADIVTARIAGFGKDGYMMAVEAAAEMVKRKHQN